MKTRILRAATGLLIIASCAPTAWSDTYVCGNVVNQIWTKAESPYRVTCDAVISSLTIEPGVEVLFETDCVFRVAGGLTAVGTEAEPIIFTRTNGTGGWQGIFFNQNLPGSELAYCVISRSANSGIRIYRATPSIRNCVIAFNSSPSVGGGLVITNDSLAQGNMALRDCAITNNLAPAGGGGIFAVMGTNTLTLQSCNVSQNEVIPASSVSVMGGGIFISGNGKFVDCQVHGNTCKAYGAYAAKGGGVYSEQGVVTFVGSSISYNLNWGPGATSDCYGGGICLTSASMSLTNCLLLGNGLRPTSYRYGSGLVVEGSTSRAVLANCIVAHNTNSNPAASGSAVTVNAGVVEVINCTVAYNDDYGLYRAGGTLTVHNAIVYHNARTPNISGTATVTYSDVDGGYPGDGNISLEPFFTSPTDFILLPYSSCIDAGDLSSDDNDVCFPPSQGTVRNDMGAHGGPLACSWATTLRILTQPASQSACLGQTATFCVRAWGEQPLAYQWTYNSVPIPDATNSCLSMMVTTTNQAGAYAVVVTNRWGALASENAILTVIPASLSIALYPGLTINGEVGQTYTLEWASSLAEPVFWHPLTNLTLSVPEILWFDPQPANLPQRFYRIRP